jgi:hypothetical protein
VEEQVETAKLVVAVAAVLISIASFVIARQAEKRSKKAEMIKNLLGEKETVGFAALKLLRDGFPENRRERALVISALMQACIFSGSDRARALLYRVIELQRDSYRAQFEQALVDIEKTFDSMARFQFSKEELDLHRGMLRIKAVRTVIKGREALVRA